jgi:hypothetical protein
MLDNGWESSTHCPQPIEVKPALHILQKRHRPVVHGRTITALLNVMCAAMSS